MIKAQLQVSDATGQSIGQHAVTVSPHGTKTVNLEELQSASGTAGGLRVTYSGGMNDLLPNGGLQDQASGYSASVPFAAAHGLHPEESTQSYAELGLMSGAADPMMQFPAGTTFTPYSLLRNVGEQPAMVTPSIYWMEGGNARSSRLQTMKLQPYQTQSLDVPALLLLAGLQNFNGSFNLVFDVEGSVLMASGSVDQKNTYVFEVMPTSVKESASQGLGYWSTKNGDDSMVTLWNPADEEQDLVFTLYFSGGHYDLPVHLGPRATRMFNISEIIQNQIPDKNGTLVPPSVHEGSARISGTHAENEHILIAVDAGTYNVLKATCGWTCRNCNGMSSTTFAVLDFSVTIRGTVQMSLKDTWNTGVQHDLTGISTWTSDDTNVATVSTKGLVTGVAYGGVTIMAENFTEPWAGQVCGAPPGPCPPDQGVEGATDGSVDTPSGEITVFQGTYQYTAGQFLMTLTPSTINYDSHSVTESSPVIGSNQCWWSGSGMVQYPVVQGSTWVVATGNAGHDQYGLDTVGFGNGVVVSIIQQVNVDVTGKLDAMGVPQP